MRDVIQECDQLGEVKAMALRFMADAMLGRLARWLRLLGYDVCYDSRLTDTELVRLARAQDRILLTRDTELTRRSGAIMVWIVSETLAEQLQQLHRELGVRAIAPFSRCPLCNDALCDIPRDHAWGQVPPYIFVKHDAFRLCPTCSRFYWRGSHWQHMEQLMRSWTE
jgi:uncharacterized protein with PIN domain